MIENLDIIVILIFLGFVALAYHAWKLEQRITKLEGAKE